MINCCLIFERKAFLRYVDFDIGINVGIATGINAGIATGINAGINTRFNAESNIGIGK